MTKRIRYKKEDLEKAAASSNSVTQVMRKLGYVAVTGGSHSHISRKIKEYKIDTSHFTGQACNTNRVIGYRIKPEDVLINDSSRTRRVHAYILRRALLTIGRPYKCYECGLQEWRKKSIVLEIEHKNGKWADNSPENIEFICPNCHSQTDTYGSRKLLKNKIVKPSTQKQREAFEKIKKKTNPFWRNQDKPNSRKVVWPTKDELEKMLLTLPMTTIGKKYGVSDNAVKKWARRYEIDLKICGVWKKGKLERAEHLKQLWASGGIEDTPDLDSGAF